MTYVVGVPVSVHPGAEQKTIVLQLQSLAGMFVIRIYLVNIYGLSLVIDADFVVILPVLGLVLYRNGSGSDVVR